MNFKKIFIVAAALAFTTSTFAKDDMWNESYMNMTKEDRTKMADMHTKMADCLKSDKEMKECKQVWMDSCKEMGDKCGMMSKHHKGMKGKKGKDKSADTTEGKE